MEKLNFYGERCVIVAEIGNFNTFGNNIIVGSSTEEKATSKIGNCCSIGNGVNIGKNVELGNNVTIGDNVIIPDGCRIGNNVTIETGVALGKNNIIHSNCVLRGNTVIGANNEFLSGSIIGFWPKDIGDHHYEGHLEIGSDNFFGENTIINVGEATKKGDTTKIGDHVYSMDKVTINHNDLVAVGQEIPDSPRAFTTIISSGVSLAGHVEVGTGANLGMQTVAHQFSIIGAGAMVGMNASITKNVVPFAKVIGTKIVGYNKRPLAENLEFGSYEDDVLQMVASMVEDVASAAPDVERALRKLEYYNNKGQWNQKAYEVIKAFLEREQNGRKLMKIKR